MYLGAMATYLAHEAGLLAGVPGDRIGQWARWGHIAASVSDGDPHVYSWEDVAEAIAVHELLERGVRLPEIRATVERLGGAGVHPLAPGGLEAVGLLPLNGYRPARDLLRAGGWPARRLGAGLVEVDPGRMGGVPCLRGTRIPVADAAADPTLAPDRHADAVRWMEESRACAS